MKIRSAYVLQSSTQLYHARIANIYWILCILLFKVLCWWVLWMPDQYSLSAASHRTLQVDRVSVQAPGTRQPPHRWPPPQCSNRSAIPHPQNSCSQTQTRMMTVNQSSGEIWHPSLRQTRHGPRSCQTNCCQVTAHHSSRGGHWSDIQETSLTFTRWALE